MSFIGQYLNYEYYVYAYGIYTVFSPQSLSYGIMCTLHTVLPHLGAGSTENDLPIQNTKWCCRYRGLIIRISEYNCASISNVSSVSLCRCRKKDTGWIDTYKKCIFAYVRGGGGLLLPMTTLFQSIGKGFGSFRVYMII